MLLLKKKFNTNAKELAAITIKIPVQMKVLIAHRDILMFVPSAWFCCRTTALGSA
jgi:hypothetical protein